MYNENELLSSVEYTVVHITFDQYNNIITTIVAVYNIKRAWYSGVPRGTVSNKDHQSYHDSILVIFMLIYMREKIAMDNGTILKFERVRAISFTRVPKSKRCC